jgi:hypothetical protein
LIAVALCPISGVMLAVWTNAFFGDHSHDGGVAWSHPLYLIFATLSAIVFVSLSGGRGWEPAHGFYPMYGWLALGVLINLLLLSRPWRLINR